MWLSRSSCVLNFRPHSLCGQHIMGSGMSLFRLFISSRRDWISWSSVWLATSYRERSMSSAYSILLTIIESSSSPRDSRTSSSLAMLSFDQNSLIWLFFEGYIIVMLWRAFAATLDKSMSSIFESLSTSINFGITLYFSINFYLLSACKVTFIIIPTE